MRRVKMWTLLAFLELLMVIAVVTSAMVLPLSASPPPGPGPAPQMKKIVPVATYETLDDLFLKLVQSIPGFGGAYKENGTLFVYQKRGVPPMDAAQVEPIVVAALGPTSQPTNGTVVLEGVYDYTELMRWHESMSPKVLGIMDVVSTDIDERLNHLAVGVANVAAQSEVQKELPKLGIPSDAVIIMEADPIIIDPPPPFDERGRDGLQDRTRPLVGGVQVNSSSTCTLGFIARRQNIDGFVTASHCTSVQGGLDDTLFYQIFASANDLVGQELADPPLFGRDTNHACPKKQSCRYSDSAFVQVSSPSLVTQGYIADPPDNGTPWVGNTFFEIVGEAPSHPFSGDEILIKIGRSTGQTQGQISSGTCSNVNMGSITMLCSYRFPAGVAGGDSGAPVVVMTDIPGKVHLYGIVFARNTLGTEVYFSEIAAVQAQGELGQLINCTSGC